LALPYGLVDTDSLRVLRFLPGQWSEGRLYNENMLYVWTAQARPGSSWIVGEGIGSSIPRLCRCVDIGFAGCVSDLADSRVSRGMAAPAGVERSFSRRAAESPRRFSLVLCGLASLRERPSDVRASDLCGTFPERVAFGRATLPRGRGRRGLRPSRGGQALPKTEIRVDFSRFEVVLVCVCQTGGR
jgi:hypothetical protein